MIFGRTGQVAGLGGVSAKRIAAILALSLVAACAGGAQKKADLEGLTAEDIYKRGEYLLETDKKPDAALEMFSEIDPASRLSSWITAPISC